MISTKYLLAATVAVGISGGAQAAIVQNPDFAPGAPALFPGYGPITSWTPTAAGATGSNDSTLTGSGPFWNNGTTENGTGGTVGFIQVNGSTVGLSQTLALTIGDTYTLSYLANAQFADDGTLTTFATIGGATVQAAASVIAADTGDFSAAFAGFGGSFTATSATEVLTINGAATGSDTLLLAGVAVTDTSPTPTPEPASLLLLGVGAAATGMIRRRRA